MKKSKYTTFTDVGTVLFVTFAVNQILNEVNIHQHSLKSQFIISVILFSALLIIINRSKMVPNASERKIANFVIIYCAILVFMILISSLIQNNYYAYWSQYNDMFNDFLLACFYIDAFISVILMFRYKKSKILKNRIEQLLNSIFKNEIYHLFKEQF